jgi:hypothetical protein
MTISNERLTIPPTIPWRSSFTISSVCKAF